MPDKMYCYPNSDVLKNKLRIRDVRRLERMEKRLTMLRILELVNNPVQGEFDLKHLQSIHKYIFQDVYEWAGRIRKVDIAKGNMFCNVKFIESQAEEINALHPFREGNGRCQREFIRTLAFHAGYVINFSNVGKEEMLRASEDSFLCDYRRMEQLFAKCVRKKNGKGK